MQQNIVVIIVASLVGFFLSGYWMFYEIQFVLTMNKFEQDISWSLQAPLMLFIVILILVSFMLFLGTVGDFSFSKLKAEVSWKKLLGVIVVYDLTMIGLVFVGDYLKIEKSFAAQFLVLILLVATYIYASIKYKINPLFFLVSLCTVSTVLFYILEVVL